MKQSSKILLTSITIIFCTALILIFGKTNKEITKIKKQYRIDTVYVYPDSLTKTNLMFLITKARIKHPMIVYKQALLETGNLDCNNCSLKKNNLFGFRVSSGYKEYTTWQSSVYDYAQWQREHYKGGDYYKFLINIHYAEDSNYINKLKQILEK